MHTGEIYDCLPQLLGKEIKKICYCEQFLIGRITANLYFEFADGSHFEMYTEEEMRFIGIIPFNPELGSIVDRTFDLAKRGTRAAAKIEGYGSVTIQYGSELL